MSRGPRRGLLVAGLAALLIAGCGTARPAAPAEGAARMVPADALAYVHLSLAAADPAVTQLRSELGALPLYRSLVAELRARLSAVTGQSFSAAIEPWLGAEAAVAFVPDGSRAGELIVLGIGAGAKAHAAARRFAASVGAGVAARVLNGYVVVGTPSTVAAVGTGRSLAQSGGFRRGEAAAPAGRVLDAYGTGSGLAALFDGHVGLAAVGAAILADEAPTDVTAAVSPTHGGLGVWVRMDGVPGGTGGFSPKLAADLPSDATWVAQMPSLVGSAPGLLAVLSAASSFGDGASSVTDLVQKLGPALEAEGVQTAPLQALFNHPSAIFDLGGGLGVITETGDDRAAALSVGNAGQALAELFALSDGQSGTSAPLVSTSSEHGVEVTQYQEGPSSQLDLAVFHHLIVATTSPTTMAAIITHGTTLAQASAYRAVLPQAGKSTGPVLFGAVNRLLRRGGQTGLLESLGLQGMTRTLARISAAGLASTSDETHTTAELYFTIL